MSSRVSQQKRIYVILHSRFTLVDVERIVADEEQLLKTIEPNSQEAIVSCMSLHWINDLPGESNITESAFAWTKDG
jgi:NADH dehydrogenase [ubiquinone] 1 alpha subcomplex assembly factor 5